MLFAASNTIIILSNLELKGNKKSIVEKMNKIKIIIICEDFIGIIQIWRK